MGLRRLKELDLSYGKLDTIDNSIFSQMVYLKTLWLQHNSIRSIGDDGFNNLQKLTTLDLSFNRIGSVNLSYLFDLRSIKSLSFSYNDLTAIDSQFGEATTLEKLNLSHNKIEKFDENSFEKTTRLMSLDLRSNAFKKLPNKIFKSLHKLTHIYFDDFRMCSYVANVSFCHPPGDGISSNRNLLDNIMLRVFVWIVAFVGCVGNISVFIGHKLTVERNEVHSYLIKNLAMADFLMGIYLFIIAYYDVVFHNEYIRHELDWLSSWQCHFSGVVSTISSESSVLTLAFITAERYIAVMHPYSMKRRKMMYAKVGMLTVWISSIVIAAIPLWLVDDFYGNNGVCTALKIQETYSDGWKYSVAIFCGLNSIAFAFIAYAYIRMSLTNKESNTGLRTTQQQQERNIAKRCAFIVASNGLCWLPIVVIKIVALFGIPINQNLHACVAIFLLSVNSAINPVLYNLISKTFKQHLNCFKSNWFSFFRHNVQNDSNVLYQNPNFHGSATSVNIEADLARQLMPTINELLAANAGEQFEMAKVHTTSSTGQTSAATGDDYERASIHEMKKKELKLRASDANKDAVQALMLFNEPVAANTRKQMEMVEMDSNSSNVKRRKRTTKNNHRNAQTSTATDDDDYVPKIGTDSVTYKRASSHEKKKKEGTQTTSM